MLKKHDFWADRMADEIIARVKKDEFLNKIVKKNGYLVYDEKTPSGEIHIGSGRGWIIHDVITKALKDKGVRANFVLSNDDIDPLDKPVPEKPDYNKYLGMPFRNIPSPYPGYRSWADYYFKQATDKFDEYGIDAGLASTGKDYEKGVFNDAIKIILDNSAKVQNIFQRVYNKPYNKIPFNPICEKCGKIGTTETLSWDNEKETITYICRKDLVTWSQGCNHKGETSPYNGSGKLPWKVEWAAKWVSKKVMVETGGKDHFTQGGSRTIAVLISNEIFRYPAPYPSYKNDIGKGYEFFNVRGKKMSTSKGFGVGFAEISNHVPANILRFLVVSSRPHTAIDFDPYRKDDLLLLYDRYDNIERLYYGLEDSQQKEEMKRVYEFSQTGKINNYYPPHISLRHAGVLVQVAGKKNDNAIELLKKRGVISKKISKADKEYLIRRLNAARQWINEFAPESERFTINQKMSKEIIRKLNPPQKKAAKELSMILRKKDFNDQELFNIFYDICDKVNIKNTEFFKGMYLILINKERGPKLANLILTIGKKHVINLVDQIL